MNWNRRVARARRMLAPAAAVTPVELAWMFTPEPKIDRILFLMEQMVFLCPTGGTR